MKACTAYRRRITIPYSEVAMHLGVAGREMVAEKVGQNAVQLIDDDGKPFSFPITAGEAGWRD